MNGNDDNVQKTKSSLNIANEYLSFWQINHMKNLQNSLRIVVIVLEMNLLKSEVIFIVIWLI